MNEKQQQLVEIAREYCGLIEQIDDGDNDLFNTLIGLLPRLHASIVAFGSDKDINCHVGEADLDARFELFSRLKQVLGERDSYWLEFDNPENEFCKSGSLADDLTDIYCELKSGLLALEDQNKNTGQAVEDWRCAYKFHWGKHLVDAEKHLLELQASNRL